MKNVFDKAVTDEMAGRIKRLTPDTKPLWGKMNVAQMLAHCYVPYDMAFSQDSGSRFKQATGLKAWFLKKFIKPLVVGDKPYKKNGPTAPEFKIVDQREFEVEQQRLLAGVERAYESGRDYFEQRPSPSFGPMTATEWSNLFYKHLDHHLQQFGV